MLETMESSVNGEGVVGGFSHLQSCGDSSEEELSVLPRHTKVVVTGNNRTKSVLVGLQGVVKKAVGLGGWHWLVIFSVLRKWVLCAVILGMVCFWMVVCFYAMQVNVLVLGLEFVLMWYQLLNSCFNFAFSVDRRWNYGV